MTMSESPEILDVACGGRMMWHDESKDHDNVLYADRRAVESSQYQESWSCSPDVQLDVRELPFVDGSFNLICFDPPHRVTDEGMEQLSGVIEQKYGALRAETWPSDLSKAFEELWRVLEPGGTLTLKWADSGVPHDKMLSVLPETPMYGVTTEKERAVVKWWVFHKDGTGTDD
jgi:SAM-dependent methyltransferase